MIHCENCLDTMRRMEPNSVDAIVTDPPYGLKFMGKKWDHDVPGVEIWRECLRVLKPGGYLLAFAGTRTQHRMACAIEDAGFEIRDVIMWVYGSGFPKSLDISKAIDKANGAKREILSERPAYGIGGNGCLGGHANGATAKVTAPATDAARQWAGWGTALKPSTEPITMARKPVPGTVAANVQQWGTGGINVDGCRIGTEEITTNGRGTQSGATPICQRGRDYEGRSHIGRFPANLIHDGSDEVTRLMPETTARFFYCAKASAAEREIGLADLPIKSGGDLTDREDESDGLNSPRAGAVRGGGRRNHHPTVKPIDLMRYLCRLVTPPGGLVYDPFTGSGTTLIGAKLEGFRWVGSEMDPEYAEIARRRVDAVTFMQQMELFG